MRASFISGPRRWAGASAAFTRPPPCGLPVRRAFNALTRFPPFIPCLVRCFVCGSPFKHCCDDAPTPANCGARNSAASCSKRRFSTDVSQLLSLPRIVVVLLTGHMRMAGTSSFVQCRCPGAAEVGERENRVFGDVMTCAPSAAVLSEQARVKLFLKKKEKKNLAFEALSAELLIYSFYFVHVDLVACVRLRRGQCVSAARRGLRAKRSSAQRNSRITRMPRERRTTCCAVQPHLS